MADFPLSFVRFRGGNPLPFFFEPSHRPLMSQLTVSGLGAQCKVVSFAFSEVQSCLHRLPGYLQIYPGNLLIGKLLIRGKSEPNMVFVKWWEK